MEDLGSDLPEGEEINSLVPWGWPVFEPSVPRAEKNYVEKYGSALDTHDVNSRTEKYSSQNKEMNSRKNFKMAIKQMRIKSRFRGKNIDIMRDFYFKGERLFYKLSVSLYLI